MENNVIPAEITSEFIKGKIYYVRGHKIMLDFDLVEIYGYETRYLNLQVKRNAGKFPKDFMFQLRKDELERILK